MQMIEMDDMVVLILGTVQQVAEQARIGRDLDADSILDGPDRGNRMDISTHTAGALYEMMGIPWVASLKYHFNAAEHLPGAPGIDNLASRDFHLDAKMPFDSGDWIDYNSLAHMFSFPS
jgi:hypothetical protein